MGLFDSLFNLFANQVSANNQYQNQRALNQQAYDLTQQGYRESPANQRAGLEAAGYNPILAASNGVSYGSFSGGSASMASNPASGIDESITNAYRAFKLEREKNKADIQNTISSSRANNASVSLINEQAKTEQYRQKEMESQTALNNINKLLGDKQLSWYDKRQLMEIKTGYINAQANHLMSEANQLNAHTAQKDYLMRKGVTDYENVQRKALVDFINKHPKIKSTGNLLETLGLRFGGSVNKNFK